MAVKNSSSAKADVTKISDQPATTNETGVSSLDHKGLAPKKETLVEKPKSQWIEGTTLWSSPIGVATDGKQHRVRLLKTDFRYPLLRVEEDLTAPKAGGEPEITKQKAMVADHLLVKAAEGVDKTRLSESVKALGGSVMNQIPGSDVYLLSIPAKDGQSLPRAVEAINLLKGIVAYAEPDFIVHSTTTPNDTRYSEQWSLNNTGQTGGTVDADIDAPEAWALSTGSNSVIVAVLDSGIDYTHPDLAGNIWSNTAETAGNSVDDDHNGYVDDTLGWNFVYSNNTPLDDDSHGTHVAGIIGAAGNNGAGVSGVAWQVKLMPLKFLNSSGYGATSDAIAGINYARVKGANIINHSWGGISFSQSLKDAIDAAGAAGILNVCAANNGNRTNEDVTPNYPSGFASASVIAVASTTETDALSSFSDYGASSVHLAAPGSNILSTIPNAGYGLKSGTSMATPHVSGIAALLKAYKPTLTGADIKAILQSSVDVGPALIGSSVTGGRANAFRALDRASDISVVPSSGLDFLGYKAGPFTPTTKTYTLKNQGAASASWTAVLNSAYYASVSPASGTLAAGASTTVTVTLNTTTANSAAPGLYDGSLTVTNTSSGKSTVWPERLDVRIPYIYSYDLTTDPGWARDEAWQFGVPTGKGGSGGAYGNPDPTSGHTGSNVFGVNLNGDSPTLASGTHSVIAGPFDLRGYSFTKLDFWRWLNAPDSYYSSHTIEVRNEGSTDWTLLWSNAGYLYDNAWTEQVLPLGSNGDGHSAVYVRWTYTVGSASSQPTSSWNIDDIKITGLPGKRVFIDGAASANENAGTVALTLHVEPASPTALTVSLASSDTTAATLPVSVVVPANTSSVSVTATLVDDALRDGTQTAVLTPTATGYTSVPWNLAVNDNETATLTLNVPASATEGGAALQGTVTMSAAAGRNVIVNLASSQPNAASVPANVTILSGQTSATFAINLPQNGILEGAKTAQITATVANWTNASANIVVADDESLIPVLNFPLAAGNYTFAEGMDTSSYVATISLSAPRLVDTVFTLSMNDTTEFTLPTTVTIPAGKLSANISPITVIDDALQDGVQTVVVTASASGLTNGTANVTVADNEVTSFAFDYITSPQTLGGSVYTVVRALDVNGAPSVGFNGTATITALNNGVADASFGSTTATFYSGVANFTVGLPTLSSSYALKAVSGTANGTSNTFAVESPAVQAVSVSANEIAFDPGTNRLYASTASGTIVPINPDTGVADAAITVSSGAVGQIEIPATGSILYAVVNNGTQIVKVNLSTRAVGTPFSVGTDSFGNALTVADFAILPNDNTTIGVALNPSNGTTDHVAIYTNGVKRSTVISYNSSSSSNPVLARQITAGSQSNRFYASNGDPGSSSATLYLLDVTTGGVQLARSYVEPGTLTNLTANGSLIAEDSGRVFQAETGNQLGRIGTGSNLASVYLDEATGLAAQIIHITPYYYDPYALSVFELNGYSETGRAVTTTDAPVFNSNYYPALPSRIVKAGAKSIAYRTSSSIMLVRSYLLPVATAPQPDLAVQQIAAPSNVAIGQSMSFNMLVRNNGNAAASNVVLKSDWTAGSYLGASTTKGTFSQSGSRLTVNIGSLAANETATVCLQMTAAANLTNTATVTTTTAEALTTNNVHSVTIYPSGSIAQMSTMALSTTDLAYSKVTQRVYAPQGFGTGFFAGTLAVMDLSVPAVRAFVPVGSSPGTMAMAENQTDLSIALDGSGQVLPLNVSTLVAGTAYAPGTASDGRRLFAQDMAIRPGGSGQVLISRRDATGAQAGVGLFGSGSLIGSTTPITEQTQWLTAGGDSATAYSYGADSSGNKKAYRLAVSGSGVSIATSRTGVDLGRRINYTSGRALGANGKMLDPATLADMGSLDDPNAYGYQPASATAYDAERERVFSMLGFTSQPFAAYSSLSFQKTAQFIDNYLYTNPDRLVRWGNHGLVINNGVYVNSSSQILWINSATLVPDPPIHVNLPVFVMENAGTLTGAGTVQLTVAPASNLTVALTSSNPSLLQVPATVTVLAGQTSATFNLTLTNDALLNGARNVMVTPSEPAGYVFVPGTVEVRDDEIGTLTMTAPASVTEGAGAVSGQSSVTLTNGPAAADIIVQLSSNRTDKLTVPATVTIPAGQSTASFALNVLDDSYVDGTQAVTLTASVGGWDSATRTINVVDNEPSTISLGFGASVTEGYGVYPTTVQIGGLATHDVIVSLTSSKPSKITVPATVTIPAGSSSVTLNATVNDDSLQDGRQTVTITGTASGFSNASQNIVVIDNDVGALQWSVIPNVSAGDLFDVTVTATTIDGDPLNVYVSSITPTAARGGTTVPVTGTLGGYSNLTGTLRITQAGANTVLSVSYNGVTSTSNAFNVSAGPMNAFVWDPIIGSPQPNSPIPVTIRAADGYGNLLTSFTGTASLSAAQTAGSATTSNFTDSLSTGLDTSSDQARLTQIVSSSQINRSGRIRSLSLEVKTPPGRAFDNFIIRAKPTFSLYPDATWDNAGYTVLRQGPLNLTQTKGWVEIPFTTPLDYNGTSNLQIELLFANSGTAAGGSYFGDAYNSYARGASVFSTQGYGSPDTWTYYNPYPSPIGRPNMRLSFGTAMTVTPAVTGNFVNGVWTGNVTFSQAASNVFLIATNGISSGESNVFEVGSAPPAAPVVTALPTYNTAVFSIVSWASVPTATDYYAEAATDNTFAAPVANSGWITGTSYTFTGLTQGTHYYFRVKARKTTLVGSWSNVVDTTVDAAGPVITLGNADDGTITAFTTTKGSWVIAGKVLDSPAGVTSLQIILGASTYNWSYGTDGTWGLSLTIPSAGTYAISFRAYDAAGNITQRNVTITRSADTDSNGLPDDWQTANGLPLGGANNGLTADFDHDGRSNLLEYACNTPANGGTGNVYPSAVSEVKSADGKSYLVYRYDRRRGAVDLSYQLQFSTDLVNWSSTSYQTELVGTPSLNSDGVTERVVVRALPDLSQISGKKLFVRLLVTSTAP